MDGSPHYKKVSGTIHNKERRKLFQTIETFLLFLLLHFFPPENEMKERKVRCKN